MMGVNGLFDTFKSFTNFLEVGVRKVDNKEREGNWGGGGEKERGRGRERGRTSLC
jgi:hypothetical protein